ncbi:hypothetical protein ACH427_15650 [Streptomyces sp. NPDC020379]|uniref:hypothetical protein n=1 Tax=Streptomyces sp. NPDC020379 TaxID=3365071 RepID=UPI0037889936
MALSPRAARIAALLFLPAERDRGQRYFQRYGAHVMGLLVHRVREMWAWHTDDNSWS